MQRLKCEEYKHFKNITLHTITLNKLLKVKSVLYKVLNDQKVYLVLLNKLILNFSLAKKENQRFIKAI